MRLVHLVDEVVGDSSSEGNACIRVASLELALPLEESLSVRVTGHSVLMMVVVDHCGGRVLLHIGIHMLLRHLVILEPTLLIVKSSVSLADEKGKAADQY